MENAQLKAKHALNAKKKGHFAKMCYTGKNKQRQGINKVEQAPKYDSEDTDSDGEKPDPHNIKKITVKTSVKKPP